MTVNLIHEDCDPTLAQDKTLPYNAYLVEYTKESRIAYDISTCSTTVELFDEYYDKYKKDFISFKQAAGKVAPAMWNRQKKAKAPNKPKK